MAETIGQKELKSNWPIVEGDTFGTTKTHTKTISLKPTSKSLLRQRNCVGL